MAAVRRYVTAGNGRPKWRRRDIAAETAERQERRVRARGQRMRIENVEPKIETLCGAVATIFRLTGQPVPAGLAGGPSPDLKLIAGERRPRLCGPVVSVPAGLAQDPGHGHQAELLAGGQARL
jgi:hypothetical protein